MKNKIKFYSMTVFWQIALMFCTGTVLQTHMISIGIKEETVYLYNALIQIMQVLAMFLSIFFVDNIKKCKKAIAISYLTFVPLFAVLLLSFSLREHIDLVTLLIFLTSILAYFFYGINNILSFRLPYEIIDMSEYGKLVGVSTALAGAFAFIVSIVYSVTVKLGNYVAVMNWFYIFSMVMVILSFYFSISLKSDHITEQLEPSSRINVQVFKDKKTWILAIPNFTRGFAYGVITLMTVVGFSSGILDTESSTYLSIALQIATFTGNVVFALLYRKLSSNWLLIVSSVFVSVFLPFSILREQFADFLIGYLLVQFFLIIMNSAVPTVVSEIIPFDEIGAFSSIRMMLYTFGSVVASLTINTLSNSIGFFNLFLIAAAAELICGIGYYCVTKRAKKVILELAVPQRDSSSAMQNETTLCEEKS